LGVQWKTLGQLFEASSAAVAAGESKWPDTQIDLTVLDRNDLNFDPHMNLGKNERVFIMVIYCGRPKSKGALTLRDNQRSSPPRIDFNFLSHPKDGQVLFEGNSIQRLRNA
jgi:hypothetical protein